MGFSRQEYWSGLPFPSSVDHILSDLSTMTCPSWVALHSMAHSFIELDKAVVRVIRLVGFLWWWFSVCLPSDGEAEEDHRSFLMGETDWRGSWVLFRWAGPCSVIDDGGAVLPPSYLPGAQLWWGNEDNGDAFKRPHACTATLSAPTPQQATTDPLETPGHSQASLGQSLVWSPPFSWVLVHKVLSVPSKTLFPSPV